MIGSRVPHGLRAVLALGILCLTVTAPAGAQTSWYSAASGSWTTGADWNGGEPTISELASITATGSAYTVTVSSSVSTGTLYLGSTNATLLLSGSDLYMQTNGGTSTIFSGVLQLSGGSALASDTTAAGFTITNAGTINSTSGSNLIYSNGGSGNGLAFTNTGTINVTGNSTLRIGDGAYDSVLNSGAITVTGATLELGGSTASASSFHNSGTLAAGIGGVIEFLGTFNSSDLGTINASQGTLEIGGTLENASATLEPPASGIYTLYGGTIVGGTVDNTGSNPALTFSGNGGTLSGVAMHGSFSVPSSTTFTAGNGTTFSGGTTTFGDNYIALNGSVGTAVTIASGATWIGNVQVTANAANLGFVNNGTFTNSSGSNNIYGGNYLGFTVTNTGTMSATSGNLTVGNEGADSVTNSGTIAASGGSVSVAISAGDSFTNTGLVEATASGSVLTVGGSTSSWSNAGGTIQATNGGTVDLAGSYTDTNLTQGRIYGAGGTLNLTGSLAIATNNTLQAPNSGIYTLDGATISGGTISGANNALQFSSGGGVLSGVSMTGNFTVPANTYVTLANGTTFSGGTTTFADNYATLSGNPGTSATIAAGAAWTGNVQFSANAANLALVNNGTITNTGGSNNYYGGNYLGFTFTNNGTVSATAGNLYLGNGGSDSVVNSGLIEANGGSVVLGVSHNTVTNSGTLEATGSTSTLTVGGTSSTWTNTGTIEALSGGVVNLAGALNDTNLSSQSGATVTETAGTLNIVGTVTNAGALPAPALGIFTLDGGTISGGTASSSALTFGGGGGVLSGVALSGNFSIPSGAVLTVENGSAFSGSLTFGGGNTVYMGGSPGIALDVAPGQTWTSSSSLAVYSQAAGLEFSNQGTLVTSAGGTFGGNYNTGFVFNNPGSLSNTSGTLNIANYPGDAVVNSGTIGALASGSPSSVYLAQGAGASVTNTSVIEASSTGANAAYLYVADGTSATALNSGTIEAVATGAGASTAYVGDGPTTVVTNTGTLLAQGANSLLVLGNPNSSGTWSNVGGTIEAIGGGVVELGGTFSSANLTQGSILGAGGTIEVAGTLDNSGTLLPPNSGIYTLFGGTISGGTVNSAVSALAFTSTGGVLNAVAMTGNFTVPSGAGFTVENGTSFAGNMSFGGGNTLYLNGTAGTAILIGPGLTWSDSGNLTIYAEGPSLQVTNQGTLSVAGGTFGGNYNTGFVVNNSGTLTNEGGTLSVANYPGDAVVNSGTIDSLSTGGTYSYVYLGQGANTTLTNSSTLEADSTGSTTANLYVGNGTSATVTNTGTIEALSTGTGAANAFVGDGTTTSVANTGTLLAQGAGSVLVLANPNSSGTWTNLGGTIEATGGGVVELGGTFSSANLTQGNIFGAGGAIEIAGTLNNTGTLVPPNSGIYALYGGTISGGTVNSAESALTFTGTGGVLSDVAMVGNFTVPASAVFTVENGTTSNGNLTFGGGNTIYLGGPSGVGLLIAPPITWSSTGSVTIYAQHAGMEVENEGTFSLEGGTWGGDYYTGFVVNNSGTLANTSGTLTVANYPGDSVVNSGTIESLATGASTSSVYLGAGSGSTLQNTSVIEASSTGSGAAYLYLGNGSSTVVTNQGTVESLSSGSGGATTYVGNSSLTTVANAGTLLAQGSNALLVLVGANPTSAWTNSGGTIEAAGGGVVQLGGTFTNLNLTQGSILGAGGSLEITGTLLNSGTLLPPNSGIFTLYGGTISGGTVNASESALAFSSSGGVLNGVSMVGNFSVGASAVLAVENGTSFSGNLAFGGGNTVFLGGPSGSMLTIGPGQTWSEAGSLSMYAAAVNETISNEGTLALAGGVVASDYNTGFVLSNSGTLSNTNASLTIANYPGDAVTNSGLIENLATGTGSAYLSISSGSGASLSNSGTIESLASGSASTTLYVAYESTSTFTNSGTVEISGFGSGILGYTAGNVTNLASNTLTGGTWAAEAGGSLEFPETQNAIVTNSATIILSGSGSNISTATGSGSSYQSVDQTLTTNNGTLEVLGGRNFASSSVHNPITNSGTIELGGGTFFATTLTDNPGSTLAGTGTFSPASGGVTIGTGVLLSPGIAATGSYAGTLSFSSSLTLGSGGTINFDLVNASPATAGTDYDTVSATGAVTISATAITPFNISVESVNPATGGLGLANFNMTQSYQWTLVSAGSISGFNAADFTFSTAGFENSLGTGHFYVSSSGNDLFLNFTPVPEPSTWALLGAGAGAMALSGIRARRRALRRG